jgi:hypothetical protein
MGAQKRPLVWKKQPMGSPPPLRLPGLLAVVFEQCGMGCDAVMSPQEGCEDGMRVNGVVVGIKYVFVDLSCFFGFGE